MAGLPLTNVQADAALGGRVNHAPQGSAELEGGQDFSRLRQAALAHIDPTRHSRHAVLKTSKVQICSEPSCWYDKSGCQDSIQSSCL